jgi:hypothetical protein
MSFQIKIENPGQVKRIGDKVKFSTTYAQFNLHHIKDIRWNLGDGTKSTLMNPSHRYTETGLKKIKCTVNRQIIMTTTLRIHDSLEPEIEGIKFRVINNSANDNLNVLIFQKNQAESFDGNAIAWTVINNLDINRHETITYGNALKMGYKKINTLSQTIVCTPGQQIIANEDFTVGLNGSASHVNEIEIISNVFTLAAITGRLYRTDRLLMQTPLLDNGVIGYFGVRPTLWIGVIDGINQGDVIGGDVLEIVNTEISLLGIAGADIVITGGSGETPYSFSLANIVYA